MVKDISGISLLGQDFLNGKIYICQIVSNSAKSFKEYWSVVEQIEKRFKPKNVVEYHLHNSCNIAGFEVYLLKIDQLMNIHYVTIYFLILIIYMYNKYIGNKDFYMEGELN